MRSSLQEAALATCHAVPLLNLLGIALDQEIIEISGARVWAARATHYHGYYHYFTPPCVPVHEVHGVREMHLLVVVVHPLVLLGHHIVHHGLQTCCFKDVDVGQQMLIRSDIFVFNCPNLLSTCLTKNN